MLDCPATPGTERAANTSDLRRRPADRSGGAAGRLRGAVLALVLVLLAPLAVAAEDGVGAPGPGVGPEGLYAYTVTVPPHRAKELRSRDHDITRVSSAPGGEVELEMVLTPRQARALSARGLSPTRNPGQTGGKPARERGPDGVFRPYSGPGGLEEEVRELAAAHPELTELEVIGRSRQGRPILALQVTGGAAPARDRPAVLLVSLQHAREWITGEVNRRLLRHLLEGYDEDPRLRRIVNTTELWFVLVANPDGYDHTFTDERLWRKTLADNDGDGHITVADGVDPNRNFPTFWGYDNEGSSPDPHSAVYRGPAPASEPETRALDRLAARVRPAFMINYHAAVGLVLYGVGHQVATPTPDDLVLAALAGDDGRPAVEGFDPDLSAELYTTNGETTEHMAVAHGVLGFTPELSECQAVASRPDDCPSTFHFPDDETLIQAEFERNLPFALDVIRSAPDPSEPVSHLGNTPPDIVVDSFEVSHGSPQPVAATVSRQIPEPRLAYRVEGGRVVRRPATEWEGGERYGGDFDVHYREVRASVEGLERGDSVEAWFEGVTRAGEPVSSGRFTFTVQQDPDPVLVLVNEDYDGHTPRQDLPGPRYLGYYTDALAANGVDHDVWDLDALGTPHDLGVLSHYEAVVWYTGDNVITQEREDRDVLGPDARVGVHEVMQSTTVAVRDYLNEGGALLKTGDHAGYFGPLVESLGGLLYGADGAPTEPCVVETNPLDECLLLSDDFHQYWLGDHGRTEHGEAGAVTGLGPPLVGLEVAVNGGDGADNSRDAGRAVVTSSVLPPEQFPQFASRSVADYAVDRPDPFAPLNGEHYVGVLAENDQYNRLTRTVDLTGADAAALSFAVSYEIEADYDLFLVEAHTVGADDWTTLPEVGDATVRGPLRPCHDGLWDVHPFLFEHYVSEDCSPSGPTGELHALTGDSEGWNRLVFDLSRFAGERVEVSLAYVSDVGVSGTGVFVDDLVLEVDGGSATQGWEEGLGQWEPAPPPEGSPPALTEWQRSTGLVPRVLSAAVATEDTLYLPFGFEAIATAEQRREMMGRLIGYLLG